MTIRSDRDGDVVTLQRPRRDGERLTHEAAASKRPRRPERRRTEPGATAQRQLTTGRRTPARQEQFTAPHRLALCAPLHSGVLRHSATGVSRCT